VEEELEAMDIFEFLLGKEAGKIKHLGN